MRLAISILALLLSSASSEASPKVPIPAGAFRPMFGSEGVDLKVSRFRLDQSAVTTGQFSRFLRSHPAWDKSRVESDLADHQYLSAHTPLSGPVVSVSWFAAQAYCESRGGRLPSTLEWEYVAAASETARDASKDPAFERKILAWYDARGALPPRADTGKPNFYGVKGMHGLVWEWTSDFNAFFVAADNRQDGEQSKNFFCGAASTGAESREGYAAFLRYAMRGSLQANYTMSSLGFRCAYDHS
ncbi:MAG: formylglycine-generating enzyme family protein [Bdellovibrionota bacterium]